MTKVIEPGNGEYKGELTCHHCGTRFEATTEDLGIDKFKKDPNTYWFDGSAQSVNKYYAWCPMGCDLIFIEEDKIPFLARKAAKVGR